MPPHEQKKLQLLAAGAADTVTAGTCGTCNGHASRLQQQLTLVGPAPPLTFAHMKLMPALMVFKRMQADHIVSADGGDHVAVAVCSRWRQRQCVHCCTYISVRRLHNAICFNDCDARIVPQALKRAGLRLLRCRRRKSAARSMRSALGRQLAAHRMARQLSMRNIAAPQHCYIAGAAPHHCYITGTTGLQGRLSRPERAGADLLKVECVHGPKGASEVQSVDGGECLGSGVRGHAIVQRHDEAHRDEAGLVVAGRQWPCCLGQRRCQQQQRREQECTSGHGGAVVQNGLVDCTNWLWGRLQRFAVRMGGGAHSS